MDHVTSFINVEIHYVRLKNDVAPLDVFFHSKFCTEIKISNYKKKIITLKTAINKNGKIDKGLAKQRVGRDVSVGRTQYIYSMSSCIV